jgi:stage V sporulation protein K
MKNESDFASQLSSFDAWLSISNREFIETRLKNISQSYPDETIRGFFEGFYKEAEGDSANLYGVLIITDRRIVFISGEKNDSKVRGISLGSIPFVEIRKKYSSHTLTIGLEDSPFIFDALHRNIDIEALLGSLSVKVKSSRAGLSGIADVFNDIFNQPKTTIPPDIRQHKDEPRDETDDSSASPGTTGQVSLMPEIKAFRKFLLPYFSESSDEISGDIVLNDLLVLLAYCVKEEADLSENEKLYLSLLLIPFIAGADTADRLAVKDAFEVENPELPASGSFAKSWGAVWKAVSEKSIQAVSISLVSLELARKNDIETGTKEYDRLRRFFYNACQCLVKADNIVTKDEELKLGEVYTIVNKSYEGSSELPKTTKKRNKGDNNKKETSQKAESLDDVLAEINTLIGMSNIKEQVNTLVNLIRVQKEREAHDLPETRVSLHSVFYGPPGTGKTTIARLMGRVFKCLGILSKGQLIETDRAGIVAGYVGQTAIKVDEIVNEALDGILFIDEAYTLKPQEGGRDFGQEAIDVLLKRMEDYRDKLVVVVAGYPEEMKGFINSNPGLKSRFNRYFYFDHYTPDELLAIFDIFAKNVEIKLAEGSRDKLLNLFKECYDKRDRSFGNGRFVRNVFELVMERQANRIAKIGKLDTEILSTVTADDIPDKFDDMT